MEDEVLKTKKMSVPFTQVANSIINDPNISFKAKGIYAYIYSKPDGWDFAVRRIAHETKEERKSIETGVKELENAGYLRREKQSTGRVLYMVIYPPEPDAQNGTLAEKPDAQKAKVPKSQGAERAPISNKYNKQEIIQVINTSEQGSRNEIAEIIKEFEKINIACKNMYGNKTQRKAVSDLLAVHGFDRVIFLIQSVLPKTNKIAFYPNITTPIQLRDKYSQLENAVQKQKSKETTNKYNFTTI